MCTRLCFVCNTWPTLQGKVTSPPLVYEGQQESYYFQAEPPTQFGVERDLERPPVSCLLSPIYPGQSLKMPMQLVWPLHQT